MSTVIVSLLNPLKFVLIGRTQPAKYRSRHFDDNFTIDTFNQWQSPGVYRQPWDTADTVKLQVLSDVGAPTLRLITDKNVLMSSTTMTAIAQNISDPAFWIYEASIPLTGLSDGRYFVEMLAGTAVMLSEPLYVKTGYTGTLLLEYSHNKYFQNMIFEGGFTTSIRVHGLLRLKFAASKDTIYEDQVMDTVMVRSQPYRIWEFILGAGQQVPEYMVDKVNRILGCINLTIDGKGYAKSESTKWEELDEVYFKSMKAYTIEMRENESLSAGSFDTNTASDFGIFTFEFDTPFV